MKGLIAVAVMVSSLFGCEGGIDSAQYLPNNGGDIHDAITLKHVAAGIAYRYKNYISLYKDVNGIYTNQDITHYGDGNVFTTCEYLNLHDVNRIVIYSKMYDRETDCGGYTPDFSDKMNTIILNKVN